LRFPKLVDHSVNLRLPLCAPVRIDAHTATVPLPCRPVCPDLNSGDAPGDVRCCDRFSRVRGARRAWRAPRTLALSCDDIMKTRSHAHDLLDRGGTRSSVGCPASRAGEHDIARDAQGLRRAALKRIAELERSLPARPIGALWPESELGRP